ncbi:hypothetical protein D0867_07468 [Hortaea werneckii]|uniref:L-ornithine N(5)-monooxygenase [NAD(P)H] n=2 Tax=Hortaea werneckii TaxID=91943 RepID=A0A3M6ZE65_HORWE|nr:hypothetical protein D0867_07468 [Hortaea werneckii]
MQKALRMADPATLPMIHDVLIVGAGPCGLAVAARLREQTPSALFTDEEHRRFHWLAKHGRRSSVKDKKNGRTKLASSQHIERAQPSIHVLDSSGSDWMTKWHRLFRALQIEHLRSPMFFHPHPQDRDALLAYAHAGGRSSELAEITGCVGKEISKHRKKKRAGCTDVGFDVDTFSAARPTDIDERDRQDYFTPSTVLFNEFCGEMIDHYGLGQDIVTKRTVTFLDYGQTEYSAVDLFTVKTDRGMHYARAVVMATGPGETPRIPAPFGPCSEGATHASRLKSGHLLDQDLASKIRRQQPTNVLVIGGGLTSAQITDALIRSGVSKVWHLVRSPLRVKPFDVDLPWMGKYRNKEKAAFWMADDDEERAGFLRQAIGGGSVTPRYYKLLQKHMRSGRLGLYTNTVVKYQSRCEKSGLWQIQTQPFIPELPDMDFVYFATGMQGGIDGNPVLQSFNARFPVENIGGLPALTDDLTWKKDIPLFLTGKLASLRLGPGAGNLEGARMGAERVALAMDDVLGSGDGDAEVIGGESHAAMRYVSGLGSRYEALDFDE